MGPTRAGSSPSRAGAGTSEAPTSARSGSKRPTRSSTSRRASRDHSRQRRGDPIRAIRGSGSRAPTGRRTSRNGPRCRHGKSDRPCPARQSDLRRAPSRSDRHDPRSTSGLLVRDLASRSGPSARMFRIGPPSPSGPKGVSDAAAMLRCVDLARGEPSAPQPGRERLAGWRSQRRASRARQRR